MEAKRYWHMETRVPSQRNRMTKSCCEPCGQSLVNLVLKWWWWSTAWINNHCFVCKHFPPHICHLPMPVFTPCVSIQVQRTHLLLRSSFKPDSVASPCQSHACFHALYPSPQVASTNRFDAHDWCGCYFHPLIIITLWSTPEPCILPYFAHAISQSWNMSSYSLATLVTRGQIAE